MHYRKGQSAIEYLMTYGWMLLVVAIVGGAIFATVQSQCAKSSSGFTGQGVTVKSFGPTSDQLQVVFKNGANENINITQAELFDDQGNSVEVNDTVTSEINGGETQKYIFTTVSSADGCNNFDLDVTYDKGSLTNQEAQGTLTGKMAEE